MTSTQIIIFVLVMLGNGIVALWKKHKDRQEQQAAAKLTRSATGAVEIDARISARQARRAQVQQPPVIAASPRPTTARPYAPPPSAPPRDATAPTDGELFDHLVRGEMRRLAAMQAVLNAAGSSAGATPTGGSEADGSSSEAAAPTLVGGAAKAPRGRRLLGAMNLRDAILAREVLGPPRSARPWTGTTS